MPFLRFAGAGAGPRPVSHECSPVHRLVSSPCFTMEDRTMSVLRFAFVLVLALALVTGFAVASENVKSGPQVGKSLPGPFHPLNVTGPKAGETFCLYCCNGNNPVAMVFAREVTPPVAKLIKKIDEATEKNKSAQMGSFV